MVDTFLTIIVPLVVGYLFDLIFGDPHWFPHPVKGFGWIISKGEKLLNNGNAGFIKGLAFSVFLISVIFAGIFMLQKWILTINIYGLWVVNSILVYFFLANRNLIDEGNAVFKALSNNIKNGRNRLSWIVGRDTSNLSENQIRTAVFETMSENLSDGVIAPLFFYAIGGIPAMVAYKMVNTLDSMIGYKNERFIHFGKFAARTDDVLNFIPARITALLISLVTLSKRSLYFIFKYGNKHSSPNSGYPEAALAGALNCRFGGPNVYNGILVNKPFIGNNDRTIKPGEIKKVIIINHLVTVTGIMIITLYFFLYYL